MILAFMMRDELGRLVNQDPITGIHFGVICANEETLNQDAVQEICDGEDLTYNDWRDARRETFRSIFSAIPDAASLEEIEQILVDQFSNILDDVYPIGVDELAQEILSGCDIEDLVDRCGEFYDACGDSTYELEDDDSLIRFDTGWNDVTVIRSPYYTLCGPCSPCAPNAGYLTTQPGHLRTYCLGPDWFEDEKPPYPVWRVDGDELVWMPPELFDDYREEMINGVPELCGHCEGEVFIDDQTRPGDPAWDGFCSQECAEKEDKNGSM